MSTFTPRINFKCPFCGLEASTGYEGEDQVPTVFHALPMCKVFAESDIIEYLRRVNASRKAS